MKQWFEIKTPADQGECMPRFRFTISGEYESEVDEQAYGTADPREMAEVDQAQLRDEPTFFLDEADTFKVELVEDDKQ